MSHRELKGRRFVLAPYGSAGDVFPFLWLGAELHRQGAHVIVVTSPVFQKAVAHCGLRLFAVGTEAEFHHLAQDPRFWHPFFGPWYVLASSRRWFEPLASAIDNLLKPAHSVLIASAPNFPATFAARKWRRPHITVHLQPVAMLSALGTPLLGHGWGWFRHLPPALKRILFHFPTPVDFMLAPTLRRLCASASIEPPRRLLVDWWDSASGVLCLFPQWFARPQADWPQPHFQTDFPLFDPMPPPVEDTSALESFLQNGDPPLIFTAGSAMGCAGNFFLIAAQATQALGRRAIFVTAYPEKLSADLPPTILVLRYVAFQRIFPRTCVIIHHGGIGTTAQAFAAGVPQLILPISHDQPDNAERVEQLGCGQRLSLWHRDTSSIKRALAQLLGDASYKIKAREVASRLPPPGSPASATSAVLAVKNFLDQSFLSGASCI